MVNVRHGYGNKYKKAGKGMARRKAQQKIKINKEWHSERQGKVKGSVKLQINEEW